LGEVEAQLCLHPRVKEAAVTVREDSPAQKRLVAYITSRDETEPAVAELREHLLSALPEYMVPSAIVILQRLPLTPSGKLDRRALPAPALDAYANQQYEPPRGDVEPVLAGIWRELLKVERVGRQDNFFELGGHSLLATRVISRVHELFGLELPIKAVFEAPRLAQLAALIESEAPDPEGFWMSDLARNLQRDIEEMPEDEVLARIAQLERELHVTHSDEVRP
jgi:acyl carrier protein